MAEIYYCRNEDDLKRVAIHIFKSAMEDYSFEDGLLESKISRCKYVDSEIEECCECELEECLLCSHLQDKDVYKNILLNEDMINNTFFPCIVCFADTWSKNERLTICSVADAKENTKYGFKYDMW